MAIIDALPGVEVSVCIDGKPVQEYEDTGEEVYGPLGPKTVVKYIEAISDAQFSINTTVLHKESISFKVLADGKPVAGHIYQPELYCGPWIRHIVGSNGMDSLGQPTVSPFKFAEVNTVEIADATTIEKDVKIAASLGELVIEMHRVKVGKRMICDNFVVPSGAASEIAVKAMKGRGLSHGTAFGPATAIISPRIVVHCDYLDGKDKPLARFIFRYRSGDALQKLLIIPRSPTPDPFDALPVAERERLARVAFERRESADKKIKPERRIKREHNDGDPPVNIDLTSDVPAKRLKKTSMRNPIDLTDD